MGECRRLGKPNKPQISAHVKNLGLIKQRLDGGV